MEKRIITGITVKEQQRMARQILNAIVIPREKEYQKRNNSNSL